MAPDTDRPEIDVRRRPWKRYRRRAGVALCVVAVAGAGYMAWPRLPEVESAPRVVGPTVVPTVDDPLLVAPDRNGWIRQDGLEVRLVPGLVPKTCRAGRNAVECVRYPVDDAGVAMSIFLMRESITAEVVADRATTAATAALGADPTGDERTDLRFGRARATEIISPTAPGGESRTIAVGRGRWLVVMTVAPGGDVDAYTRYRASIQID